jgi:phosphate starvation-inducible PhoH-like protein
MKLTANEEYGLRCLVRIGYAGEGGSLTIPEMSQAEGVSAAYAAKILRVLRKGGFVKAARGKDGGYTLARPPESIVIGDVMDALGGRIFESNGGLTLRGIINLDGVQHPAPAGSRSFESFPGHRKPLSPFFPCMEVPNTHLMKSSVRISRGVESLFGTRDENIRLIEAGLGVQTHLLDNNLEIEGEPENVQRAANILEDYNTLLREGHVFNNGDLNSYLRVVTGDREVSLRALVHSGKQRNFGKKVLAPKTVNQRRYLEAIERNDLVFGIGPAGTGKTYLAVAMAISALMNKQVARIVLTRPAVEAGERLGFLPGTLQEKVDPYLRPLYDALYDMLDSERVEKLLERNVIEVAPIAFMRGRTLNDSFIILDEAQNCTVEQMKMVLTRQGFNSKMVVNGDVTQIDLPPGRRSGLIDATEVLKGVEGLSFVQFDEKDVVRHVLVQRIVKAYERYNEAIGAGRQLTLPLADPPAENGNGEVKVEIPLTETAPLA